MLRRGRYFSYSDGGSYSHIVGRSCAQRGNRRLERIIHCQPRRFGYCRGIVYLGEKLINLSIGVAKVVSEIIIEKFKKAERAAGRAESHTEWMAWYERQQAALRAGQPFNEPPPSLQNGDKNSA